MPQAIVQVDAFTDRPFAGNPAAVCILEAARDAAWMRAVAGEMNLAETAFLVRRADGYDLRWFTPTLEVDLCGHATLASAHVLWEEGRLDAAATARFHTRSGVLTATRNGPWIELDSPALPAAEAAPPPELLRALGAPARWTGHNGMDWLVELASEAAVRRLAPALDILRALPPRGVIVTARAQVGATDSSRDAADFVSRFFAPAAGIDEDPVTGSAHCALAPFWRARTGRDAMIGYQASRRGGTVRVRLAGDRVLLGGQAVTTLRGVLLA